MANVRGCDLPDDLLYDVANNMWYREEADGTVLAGMTSVALALAGQLVAVTPRKAGRAVQAGKSCATADAKPAPVPGTQVAAPYEAKMMADGFAGCTAAAA